MKVLLPSKRIKWQKKITCPYCKARLLVEEKDLHFEHSSEEGYWLAFMCPECGKDVDAKIDPYGRDSLVWDRIERKRDAEED